MRLVGEHIEEVSESAENDKGAELYDDPFEREEVGARGEVQELEGDGEVGGGDQEVAHFLALEYALGAPERVAIAVAAGEADLNGGGGGEEEGKDQEPMEQCS